MDTNDKLLLFEEYYNYLESSFTDVVRIIPLENNPETFSPRLYEILHSVCSQIEGVLKLMCNEMCIKYTNFPKTYKKLNRGKAISKQEMVLRSRPKWKSIRPFQCDFACHCRTNDDEHPCGQNDKTPKWWDAYNTSKHDLPEGYKMGTIENTYLALASLYALQSMMCFINQNKDGFLKHDYWFSLPLVTDTGKPNSYARSTRLSPTMFNVTTRFVTNDR